jgi:hypothetical protein
LAGLGTVALVRAARRRHGPGPSPHPRDARLVLVTAGALVALSVVFTADRWRPDHLVYGRYNDAVLGPLVLVGIGALVTAGSRRIVKDGTLVVIALVAAGVTLHLLRDEELRAGGAVRSMVLGLQAYVGEATAIRVLPVTVTAVLVSAVVIVTAVLAQSRGALLLVAVVLLAVGYARTRPIVDRGMNSWAVAGDVQRVRDTILPPGAAVGIHFVPDGEDPAASWSEQRLRAMLYQFYLPENPLYRDGDLPPDRPTPFVFAPLGDPALTAAGAEVVWRDPRVAVGLWIDPRSP